MQIEAFAEALALPEKSRNFLQSHGWKIAEESYSARMNALTDAFIAAQLGKLRRPEDPAPLLHAAAAARQNALAGHCLNYLLYYWWESPKPEMYGAPLPTFDMVPGLAVADAEALVLLAALAAIPYVEQAYAQLGLPEKYAADTVQYISGAIDEHRAGHDGRLGFGASPNKLHWLRFYLDGVLFRIGRFEYMIQDPLPYLPAAYRRKRDGQVIALCRHGWKLNREGLQLWTDEEPGAAYRTAKLECDGATLTGIPIDPRGFAEVERTVTLDLTEYEPLWQAWDLVPGVHIPGGGSMTPEACRASFAEALEFFPKYFHRKVAAFSCFSWIFNTDFERELPESNLAKLMREVYLFPFPSTGSEGLVFVFGKDAKDWHDFPADNTLRRAFHRLREAGRRLRGGGMILDAEAVSSFGSQTYRKKYEIGTGTQRRTL